VPAVLHHDSPLALTAMQLLEPHVIMRKGLIGAILYPRFVEDISTFMAQTLFFSSDLALSAAEKKQGIAAFAGNHALCKITEDLIFTDPYRIAEQNRWTSPWLDATAARFCEDLDAQLVDHDVVFGPVVVSGPFGRRRIAFVEAPGGIRLEFMEQLSDVGEGAT